MATLTVRTLADKKIHGIQREDGSMVKIPPEVIKEEPGFNLRDYNDPAVIAHIEAFADSFAKGRVVPPMLVRVDDSKDVYVIEGHCRLRGLRLAIERGADIKFVTCIGTKANDVERLQIMLRSGDGLKYKPLFVAQGYLRFTRMGLSTAQIAEHVGRTQQHVENMLLLAHANSDVHDLVNRDVVAAHVAIEAVREHGEKAGAVLIGLQKAAKLAGKPRVTAGVLKGPRLPPKTVARVVDSLGKLATNVPVDMKERIADMPDDAEVSIPVSVYRDILEALDALRDGQEKLDRKTSKGHAEEPLSQAA